MKNILKKIHEVMKDVEYIQKNAKNIHHNYSYANEQTIKTTMHNAFIKHKIMFQLETSNPRVEQGMEPNKYDKVSYATVIDCKYKFYDIESGECLEGEFVASGPARDDKGLWAATTNAIKYILTSTFLIPTGDDAESNENHPAETKPAKAKEDKPKPSAQKQATEPPKTQFWKALWAKSIACDFNPNYFLEDDGIKIMPFMVKRIARLADPLEGSYENMKDDDEKWLKLIPALKTFNVKAEVPLAVIESQKGAVA